MDIDLTIHEQAASGFDERAAQSRSTLGPAPKSKPAPQGWRPDIQVTHVPEADIQGMRVREQHPVPGIYEIRGGTRVGLSGKSATNFLNLAEQVWRAIKPKGAISKERVVDLACDWLFGGNPTTALTEHCLKAAAAETHLTRVWVPITGLHVQDAFEVGDVTFEELTAARIGAWHKSKGYDDLDDREREAVDQHYADFSKKHQGYAIAWTDVISDKEQARVTALERVEDSLAMVRFFSGGALVPTSRSICTPSGRERSESYNVIYERDSVFAGSSRGSLDAETARHWAISAPEIQQLMGAGLATLSELLKADALSSFQRRIIASVRLFSDAALEARLQIKLVLVLSALEGLYLGNRGEPIQQNVGERLALVTERDPNARRALTKLVREVYETRSKFVHHAERVESSEGLGAFFRSAWMGVICSIENASAYATVKEFTGAIDLKKFGG